MTQTVAYQAARIFDGEQFHEDCALLVRGGRVAGIVPQSKIPADCRIIPAGGLIVPGFVDLQVNGGGGVLFNNDPSVDGIQTICSAHAKYGTTALMVTLITDTPSVRDRALEAGRSASEAGVPGYLGLHLEGPHLSVARKGTHDPSLIRDMTADDLAALTSAAGTFGVAKTTIAPENVSADQVRALVAAGYHVSLGHTDCNAATAFAYVEAGATLVTHIFNAMSQLQNREPGLVGAALSAPELHCGLIADGHHVNWTTTAVAMRAKVGPGRIFVVTDAMSCIGTDEDTFTLNGRTIYRRDGRLTLADGTLAGADIDMLQCLRLVHDRLGLSLEEALRMVALYPARAIGADRKGRLSEGADADFVVLTEDLDLCSTWIGGACVYSAAKAD
ncbi:N-acetylglucosamine-6-phosphate deacetylase [Rhizobium sp. PAMB 3174]